MTLRLTYKGFNYVDYYDGEYSDNNTLAGVAATGANAVALTPDYGIDVADSTIYAGGATTDTPADLATAIHEANAEGLTSFVRPLIDFLYPQASTAYPGNYYVPDGDSASNPSGYIASNVPTGVTPVTVPASAYGDGDTVNYRGELSPLDINVTKFFGSPTQAGSYDAMIVSEAKAAQAAGAQLFSIGTEMDSLATDTNASVEADWTTLIADVRAVFTGKLTYSANWSTANQVTFWNKLDLVGIDGYVPLSNATITSAADNPTEASLVAGWTTVSNVAIAYSGGTTVGTQLGGLSAVDYFDELAQQSIDKQFIFSEFGYQNDTSAAADPTGGSNQGVADPSLQAELYQAFFDAWGGAQKTADANGGLVDGHPFSLAGAYIWNWNPDTSAAGYDDWSPNGYPAATVITAGYTVSGPAVVPEKGVAGVAGYEGNPTPAHGTAGTTGTGALAGDSDGGGAALTVSAVAGGTVGTSFATTYGWLTLDADGSYTYFANSAALAGAPTGAPVSDTIGFTVTDAGGASTPSTLTISDYRDPVAKAQSASLQAGQTATGTAGVGGTGLLAGDTDPDGAALSVGSVYSQAELSGLTGPTNPNVGAYGTLTVDANGSYSYKAESAVRLAGASAANKGAPLTDMFTASVAPVAPVGTYAVESVSFTITSPTALSGTAAAIEANLSGLQADAPYFTTLTVTSGAVAVSVASFLADQTALDKIVGSFAVVDSADNVASHQAALEADHQISTITATSATSTAVETFNITGEPYTGTIYTFDLSGQLLSARYTGITGQAYQSFETDYSNGTNTQTQYFYTGITGQPYTTETLTVNAAGQQTAVTFGGLTGAPYSSYAYDYNAGLFAGSKFTYTAVPAGATYSSYETDYNFANTYLGARFFTTNITGQSYTGEEVDTTAAGVTTRVLLTGYTGQPYQTLELDYTGGAYTSYKTFASNITGQSYTGLEEDVTAAGQLTKVVYTGLKSTPYTTLEQDYTGGALSSSTFTFNGAAGQTYSSYSVTQNAAGTQISETVNNTNGSHTIVGSADGLIFEAIGNDKIKGGGSGETFDFSTVFGHDTITDFSGHTTGAGHDTIALSSADFTSFAALSASAQNVTGGVAFTGKSGSQITLQGLDKTTLAGLGGDFTFHA